MKLEFSRQLSEKMSNLIKIRPGGGEMLHADGRTGMSKQVVAFRNFAIAPQTLRL